MEVYRTLRRSAVAEPYKVKGSKFLAFAYPVESREDIEQILEKLRATHPKANHCCYAWKLGTDRPEIRFNDDGEPTNSAGKPIYGQILAFELTNVLVAVIRYFGGTKLGVGGLIQAYREATRMSLQQSKVVEREVVLSFLLTFEYKDMDQVMRLVKEQQLDIVSQEMDTSVRLKLQVAKAKEEDFTERVGSLRGVKVSEFNPDAH